MAALGDVARAIDHLAAGQEAGAPQLRELFSIEAPSTSTLRPEALCRQFAMAFGNWCAVIEPGTLVEVVQARRIADYVEEHFMEAITLARLARITGWDAKLLSRSFRSVMGLSIREHLEAVRIDEAAARLRKGDKVESVFAAVGWRGRRNFFRHFKARMGLTPAEYREAWLHHESQLESRRIILGPVRDPTPPRLAFSSARVPHRTSPAVSAP